MPARTMRWSPLALLLILLLGCLLVLLWFNPASAAQPAPHARHGDSHPAPASAQQPGQAGKPAQPQFRAPLQVTEETPTPTPTRPTETPTVTPTLPICQPGDVTIDILNFTYSPSSVVICPGAKVTWTNRDDFRHTTTGIETVWDSGLLSKGRSFERVFDRSGTFTYYCQAHIWMRGVIIVGQLPLTTATLTPTITPTPTASATEAHATATVTASATATTTTAPGAPTVTRTATATFTPTPSPTPSRSAEPPVRTPTITPSPSPTSILLDPLSIPKYEEPLLIPPAMPRTAQRPGPDGRLIDYYEIAARQFTQHILPRRMGLPATTVWGYGSANHPETFSYPAFTIEARYGEAALVKWINDLMDPTGAYFPHFLPVDQTIHWANPAGGVEGRDGHGHGHMTYTGPIPLVTHLHGAHTYDDSDGYPEAWTLPAARNIPASFALVGSWYDRFKAQAEIRTRANWSPGSSVYEYPNIQRAGTLWYHDHTIGLTRQNVYAGLAGFYLLRGGPDDLAPGVLPGPAPALDDPPVKRYYEIPLVIQDRSFKRDGSLYLPDSRAAAEGMQPGQFQIPYRHDPACEGESDVAPIWAPDFFGNTIVVNGRTWPYLEVEPRRYRLRLLNGSNSRFYIFRMGNGLPFYQIGTEGGFLPAPVRLDQLLLGPAERADVIVDFSAVPPGASVTLLNLGPDAAFHGGHAGHDFTSADPATTGQVMQFRVVPPTDTDTTTPPAQLSLPTLDRLGDAPVTRQVSLSEFDSQTVFVRQVGDTLTLDCQSNTSFGFVEARLGLLNGAGGPAPLAFSDAVTETPTLHTTEVWEIHNFTPHAHPIHIHQVMFEVVNRQRVIGGAVREPDAGETGVKDTVIAYPGEITRVKLKFDLPGRYVWHCHLLGHEDNEMMRPLEVTGHRLWLPLIQRGD